MLDYWLLRAQGRLGVRFCHRDPFEKRIDQQVIDGWQPEYSLGEAFICRCLFRDGCRKEKQLIYAAHGDHVRNKNSMTLRASAWMWGMNFAAISRTQE
ncbi:hypothetical protein [Paraburkholderia sp. DGU8]|uniref:hypothetical protein n=1 Tax=Paraburkholderia sp. DGU8 TaxID=3161997 RepID=UPI0034650A86